MFTTLLNEKDTWHGWEAFFYVIYTLDQKLITPLSFSYSTLEVNQKIRLSNRSKTLAFNTSLLS